MEQATAVIPGSEKEVFLPQVAVEYLAILVQRLVVLVVLPGPGGAGGVSGDANAFAISGDANGGAGDAVTSGNTTSGSITNGPLLAVLLARHQTVTLTALRVAAS